MEELSFPWIKGLRWSDEIHRIRQTGRNVSALLEDAHLIVVGTRNERGARQLSSVPKAVMDRAACAVLVV
jgi:nucleotide-binding universal stress UspA family protein